MATPTDATFGAGFDADAFRSAIRSTMQMGLPNMDAQKATFRWTQLFDNTQHDYGGMPLLDWGATPVSVAEHDDVQVPVAIEYKADHVAGTPIGQFDNADAIITILDTDYALVDTADLVLLGGNTYQINYRTNIALFSVDVVQLFLVAWDET